MLDYDKCQTMLWSDKGITQAVLAAEDNDPYFPKPHKARLADQKLWEGFKGSYLMASEKTLSVNTAEEEVGLGPRKFIKGWEEYRKLKLDNGKARD